MTRYSSDLYDFDLTEAFEATTTALIAQLKHLSHREECMVARYGLFKALYAFHKTMYKYYVRADEDIDKLYLDDIKAWLAKEAEGEADGYRLPWRYERQIQQIQQIQEDEPRRRVEDTPPAEDPHADDRPERQR